MLNGLVKLGPLINEFGGSNIDEYHELIENVMEFISVIKLKN